MLVLLSLDSVCEPSGGVVCREIEGDLIIVPLVSGIGSSEEELFTVSETGRAVWQKLDGRRTLREVAHLLGRDYEASEEDLQTDVLGFASELVRRGIIMVKG